MKKPQKSRCVSGKRVLLCIKAWKRWHKGLWGMLALLMLCGCRSPQSPVTKRGAEPNRPYARQQSALSADSSKPTSAQANPSHAKTSASDATTQRPAVPLLQPTQPTQTQATRTIVLGSSPTSRPTAKFETLLTWRSFVGNAKIEKVRVYGEDRPRIVVIHYKPSPTSFVHKKALFLDNALKVQRQHNFTYEQLWVPSHGRALLVHLSTSYILAYTRLFDDSGRLRWKSNPMLVDFAAISTNLQRIVIAERGNAQVLLLNEKGQKLQKLPYIGDALYRFAVSPDDQEFVYVLRKYDQEKQRYISILSRHHVENMGLRWKMTLPYEISSLTVGKQYTAVVVTKSVIPFRTGNVKGTTIKSQLLLLDHRGQLLWQKNQASASFWPNETRMVVDSDLLETQTGRLIKEGVMDSLRKSPCGRWGIRGGGKMVDINGNIYDLGIGEAWGWGWYLDCSLVVIGDGLFRFKPPLLQKLIPCQEEKKP